MTTTARKSAATKELLRQVSKRSTGRLTLDRIAVYLMNGDIIGAETPSDEQLLLERIARVGDLEESRVAALRKVSRAGQSIFGQLLDEVPQDTIEPLLMDRFRDNLVAFVAAAEKPAFEGLGAVFVDNMQMGQNSARLIDSACKDADRASRYALSTEVVAGAGAGRDELEKAVLAAVGEEPMTVDAVLSQVDIEPMAGRAVVADLLDSGALVEANLQLQAPLTPVPVADEDDEDDDDVATVQAHNALLAADLDGPGEEAEAPEPELSEEDTVRASDDDVEAVSATPEEVAKWMAGGDHISDEDMAFFEDYEDDRGGGKGGFSTESHNLDKVDVSATADVEEVLEADEAPTAKFSAPILSEDDAFQKIEVANDVLRRIAAALDAAEGAGRGRAAIQLLVDGSPSKFTALLHDLVVTAQGELPPDELLENLYGRPPSEHRQLINSALKDVIDRALSSAADDLPDESFDTVYESIAGYNQRLGL